MKPQTLVSTLAMLLLFAAAPLHAESYSTEARPYIGLELDGAHLPDLLVKHLNLSADQGVRIANVLRDSPADKAGIERDDIIIVFQGRPVTYCRQVADAVRQAAVGAQVSFEVIHQGRRRTVNVKLEPFPGQLDRKYPPEPRMHHSWQPQKFFRLRPGDENWKQVPSCDTHNFDIDILNLFDEKYTYTYSKDDESYTITIEGDPDDDDTAISVRVTKPEYKTTVKQIDDLPRKYRANAEEALKNARQSARQRQHAQESWPWSPHGDDMWQRFFGPASPAHPALPTVPDDPTFDRLDKQMRDLQRRLDEMEKRQKKMLDGLPDELKEQISHPADKAPEFQNTEFKRM
ncbi:MAG: S1C family serine protease [Planctomycetota bacterium]|jgi:hypothetical protein